MSEDTDATESAKDSDRTGTPVWLSSLIVFAAVAGLGWIGWNQYEAVRIADLVRENLSGGELSLDKKDISRGQLTHVADALDELQLPAQILRLSDTGVSDNDLLTVACLLYTSPSPRDQRGSRMPSSA